MHNFVIYVIILYMGAKNYKSEKSSKCLPMELPEFLYFNRKKGVIIKSEGLNLRKYKPNSRFFYSHDSAIGLLKGQRIMIVGGSNENRLRSKVTMIYLRDFRIEETSQLPEPCINGWVHEIENWVYYIGGQKMENEDLAQAPIYKYHQNSKLWEEFKGDVQYNIIYKTLSNYGSCVLGKKILIVGGQDLNNGYIQSNRKVYSIDTELLTMKFETSIELEVNCPLMASGSTHAILVGGTHPFTGEINKQTLYMSRKKDCILFESLDKLNSEIVERYPPVYRQNYIFFVSYPNIVVRFRKKTVWNEFSLARLRPKGEKKKKKNLALVSHKLEDSEIWKYDFFPNELKSSNSSSINKLTPQEFNVPKQTKNSQIRIRKSSSDILPIRIPSVPEEFSIAHSPIVSSPTLPQQNTKIDSFSEPAESKRPSKSHSSSNSSSSFSGLSSSSGETNLSKIPSQVFRYLSNLFEFNKENCEGSLKDLHLFLLENLENKVYSIQEDFFRFLSELHLIIDCKPLSEKSKWILVVEADLNVNKDSMSKAKLARAICITTNKLITRSKEINLD